MAGYHIPPEMLPVLGVASLPLGEQGFAGTVFEAGQPVWSADVQNDPRFTYTLFRRFPHQSGLIIPVVLDGAPAGAFYLVWWKQRRRFVSSETAVLQTIGQQVGILLRHVRLHDALDTRAARLTKLLHVSRLVSSSLDTGEVLGEIARAAAELMSAVVVHVWVLEEDGASLTLKATSAPEISADFGAPRIRADEGGVGQAITRRELVNFPDVFVEGSPVLDHGWWKRHAYSSLLNAPIVHQQTVLGALALHGVRPFVLDDDDRALLEGFVAQAAASLHHARSYDVQGRLLVQTRRQQQEAQAMEATARDIASVLGRGELFSRITDRVRELCASDLAFLAIVDPISVRASMVAVSGARAPALGRLVVAAGEGRIGAVMESGERLDVDASTDWPAPTAAEEEAITREGLVAQFLVPLMFRGHVIGVLGAARRTPRVLQPSQRDVLGRLADQAALAIENRRLYDEQRRRSARLESLNRVTRTIARSVDARSVLASIAESVLTLFPDDACRLWVIDGGQITLAAEVGVGESIPGGRTTLRIGEGIVGRVCESGEPIVLSDVTEATDARNLDWMRARGVVSAAVVPLIAERCVGALAVVTRTRRVFDDEDLSLLRAFGEHAAVALEKTRTPT